MFQFLSMNPLVEVTANLPTTGLSEGGVILKQEGEDTEPIIVSDTDMKCMTRTSWLFVGSEPNEYVIKIRSGLKKKNKVVIKLMILGKGNLYVYYTAEKTKKIESEVVVSKGKFVCSGVGIDGLVGLLLGWIRLHSSQPYSRQTHQCSFCDGVQVCGNSSLHKTSCLIMCKYFMWEFSIPVVIYLSCLSDIVSLSRSCLSLFIYIPILTSLYLLNPFSKSPFFWISCFFLNISFLYILMCCIRFLCPSCFLLILHHTTDIICCPLTIIPWWFNGSRRLAPIRFPFIQNPGVRFNELSEWDNPLQQKQ